ncbi:MAG TPA: hypothetical protein VNT76_02725, partial [Candidatus Binatus sp.]|nr:hypothetical protein [Candidatus Binatus sp.]
GALWPVVKWLQPQDAVKGYLRKTAIAIGGFAAAHVHLAFFDKMFLRRGKLDRLLKLPAD